MQVSAVLICVVLAGELIQLGVGHVPTQACLLFADGRQEVGVGAPNDLTDVLQVFVSLLPSISERIASRHITVIQSGPLSYELGSGMSIALTRLYFDT